MSTVRTLRQHAALLRGMVYMKRLLPSEKNACASGARAIEVALAITCIDCGKPELAHGKRCPWAPKARQERK